ncbi:SDR family NAD(P)-dependent oxidoreductase [uncultured Amnibacterium sp.]|uniref:SDR family NAD(P)-dependent oxidoreductase n=1 Tax=uncultured Amnibacterium sp. TaxID=1631851 RepID=UPI0035C9BDD0
MAVVGATSGIAKESARLWAQRGVDRLVLVGRDAGALESIAADLRVRGAGALVEVERADLTDVESIEPVVNAIFSRGPIDAVLIAHGWMGSQDEGQTDLVHAARVLEVTAVSPVLWAEAFAQHFGRAGSGRIAIIGSVAGDRGRRTNYIYGSAKALVAAYAEGMAHRFAGTGVSVTIVKPGPTDTAMTSDLKAKGARLAPVRAVAAQLVAGVESRKPVVYAPGLWRIIMLVIRGLPRPIFNRLSI